MNKNKYFKINFYYAERLRRSFQPLYRRKTKRSLFKVKNKLLHLTSQFNLFNYLKDFRDSSSVGRAESFLITELFGQKKLTPHF